MAKKRIMDQTEILQILTKIARGEAEYNKEQMHALELMFKFIHKGEQSAGNDQQDKIDRLLTALENR